MAGLVEQVRTKINKTCIITARIKKEGCSVSLSGAPAPRLIVDFDKNGSPLGMDEVRCDYLFIAEDSSDADWVCPMELKRGGLRASEVISQLKAGTLIAEQIVPRNARAKFRPIAAFGGGIHRAELYELKRKSNKVSFRGVSESVRLIECGEKLTKGLRT